MKILMVLTSHNASKQAGKKAGFRLEAFAAPYYAFREVGVLITVASPTGGKPPVDARTTAGAPPMPATHLFQGDAKAQALLEGTRPLADVAAADFDAVFYPGGLGCLWDLAEDPASIGLIRDILSVGKPAAFVGHGVGALRHVKTTDGAPVTQDRDVTGFSNSEAAAAGLTGGIIPFRIEDMLTSSGGRYSKATGDDSHVVIDGLLITGQNAASATPAAQALVRRLGFVSAKNFLAMAPWDGA